MLAVGEINDVGSLETAVSSCGLLVAVVMEIGGVVVVCVILALAQAFGAAGSVWVVALTLVALCGVF